MWQLICCLKQIPRAPTVHGCVNNCLCLHPVEETEEELASRVVTLITEHEWLRFRNGDPKFKLETNKAMELILFDAPNHKFTWKYVPPQPSRWTQLEGDWALAVQKEKDGSKEDGWSYGHWSTNGAFLVDPPWEDIAEDEGIGRGPDDTFQEEMAENLQRLAVAWPTVAAAQATRISSSS